MNEKHVEHKLVTQLRDEQTTMRQAHTKETNKADNYKPVHIEYVFFI